MSTSAVREEDDTIVDLFYEARRDIARENEIPESPYAHSVRGDDGEKQPPGHLCRVYYE